MPPDIAVKAFQDLNENWTGRTLTYALDRELPGGATGKVGYPGPNGNVSDLLRNVGIVGSRYVEPFGSKPTNYVVFRDDIIDIVKKFGIAAAASMYGMDQVQRVLIADQLQPAAQ